MAKRLTPTQFLAHIRNLNNKFDVEMSRARQDIGALAVKRFKASFDRLGFDNGKDKWKSRNRVYPHTLMDETGKLKNSIGVIGMTPSRITVGTFVSYAKYHNDPSSAGWTRNQFSEKPITRRQFIGNSTVLENQIKRRLQQALFYTFR